MAIKFNNFLKVSLSALCSLLILVTCFPYTAAKADIVQLDTTFNGVGYATHHNAGGTAGSDYAYGGIVQNDGKIIKVGTTRGSGLFFDMGIWRYNSNGTLDTSFNGTGYFTHKPVGYESAQAQTVRIQADGKYLVAGYAKVINGGTHAAIWRINIDGSLDTTFNSSGYFLHNIPLSIESYVYDIQINIDGTIIAAGGSQFNSPISENMAMWKLDTNGTLDTTFNGTGYLTFDNGYDLSRAVSIQSDGKYIVAGESQNDVAVWRINTDGSLDNTFNGTGVFMHNNAAGGNAADQAYDVDIQADGKIVFAGRSWGAGSNFSDLAIWRLNTDGTLDSSFNGTGYTIFQNGYRSSDIAHGLKYQTNGKIILTGITTGSDGSSYDMLLIRFNSDGTLDTTFNSTGFTTHHSAAGGNFSDEGHDIDIQADGKYVIFGLSGGVPGHGYDTAIWRYEVLSNIYNVSGFDVKHNTGSNIISLVEDGIKANTVPAYLTTVDSGINVKPGSKMPTTDIIVAEFTLNMNSSKDWTGFEVYTNSLMGRSYINYTEQSQQQNAPIWKNTVKLKKKLGSAKKSIGRPAPTGTIAMVPGITSTTYTLYAPKIAGTKSIKLCPIQSMDSSCDGGITIDNNSSAYYGGSIIFVSTVNKGGVEYWKVSGLRHFLAATGI